MPKNKFLESVVVLDTETTHLDPEIAEIVEIAGATFNNQDWKVSSFLLGTYSPIPPDASAKNLISNRMIQGLPTFSHQLPVIQNLLKTNTSPIWVAHNCKYDLAILSKSFQRINEKELSDKLNDKQNWLCTLRLSQHLLSSLADDMSYGLNYLRYKLDLSVPDDYPAHRANADAFTCALLLEFLVDYGLLTGRINDNADIFQQLHEICWSPIIIKKWPFGKHKGKSMSQIDTDYFKWAFQNLNSINLQHPDYDVDLAQTVLNELNNRGI